MSEQAYNDIYARLIETDEDVFGIVAYALYKKHKISWANSHYERTEKYPTKEEYEVFHSSSITEEALAGYRTQAKEILVEFLDEAVTELRTAAEEAIDELAEDYQGQLVAGLQEHKTPSWYTAVFQSAIGSFVFVLMIGILYFFMWSLNIDIIGKTKGAVNGQLQSVGTD